MNQRFRYRSGIGNWVLCAIALITGCSQGTGPRDSLPLLDVTLVSSLGESTADPDAYFGSVSDIQVDSAGTIYALDAMLARVRQFGPTGEEGPSFGGPGEGPGEFASGGTKALLLDGNGDVLVAEAGRRRMLRFSPTGEFLDNVWFPERAGMQLGWECDGQGGVVAEVLPSSEIERGSRRVLHRLFLEEGTTELLLDLPENQLTENGEGLVFGGEGKWALDRDGRFAVGLTTSPVILIHGTDPTVVDTVRIHREPMSVTPTDREAVFRGFEGTLEDAGIPPALVADALSRVHVADRYSLFTSLFFGPGGRLWVHLPERVTEWEDRKGFLDINEYWENGSDAWEVYDRDGELVARVEIPAFLPHTYRGNLVFGASAGPNGEPIVQVWRVSGP